MNYLALAVALTSCAVVTASCGGSDFFGNGQSTATSEGSSSSDTSTSAQGAGGMNGAGSGGANGVTTTGPGAGGNATSTATKSTTGSGGSPPQGGNVGDACDWQGTPCAPGLYCKAPGCQAGTCQPSAPPAAAPPLLPVCGCDGVTYFDASTAAQFGQSIRYESVCKPTEAIACSATNPACPNGSLCNLQVGNAGACFGSGNGTCWALPNDCSEGNKAKGRACGVGGGIQCKGFCQLIKEGNPFYLDNFCF